MGDSKSLPDNGYFHSLNSDIIWVEGPGDTTVRPCRPERLEFLKALRARVQEAEAAEAKKQAQNGQQP